MNKQNYKYIVAFDIECTGLYRETDQIIQFSAIKYDAKTNEVVDEIDLKIQPVQPYKISMGAYFKHGITPKQLEQYPHFEDVADKIVEFFGNPKENAVLTFNGNSFDIPFLNEELGRYDRSVNFTDRVIFDSFLINSRINPTDLEGIYEKYTGQSMEESGLNAHDALSDVKATFEVFNRQKEQTDNLVVPIIVTDNSLKTFRDGAVVFNFGKYRSCDVQKIHKIDPSYIDWCLSDKCNMSGEFKTVLKQLCGL